MTALSCPVCAAGSCSVIDAHEQYQLRQCHQCDLQFWDPLRNPGNQWYEEAPRYILRDKLRSNVGLHWRHKQFLGTTLPQGSRILDIGCGIGVFAAECEKKGYEATGIDFDRNAILFAGQYFGLKRVYACTLEQFIERQDPHPFDVIAFFEVLEHQDDPVRFVSKIKRLLKPGGYIALSIPNRNRWRLVPVEDLPPNHLTRWDVAALAHFLESQGFEILRVQENRVSLQSAKSVVSGLLTKWLPTIRTLKHSVVNHAAAIITSTERPKAHAGASAYHALLWLWNAALTLPAACLLPYTRISDKKAECIYCLARLRKSAAKEPACL